MTVLEKYVFIYLKDKELRNSTLFAIGLLVLSLVANFYAGTYATKEAGNSVTDLILDNIRVYDISLIFIYGTLVFWSFLVLLLFIKPERIPFTLKSISLFVFTRSLFIMLTHIGPAAGHLVLPPDNLLDEFSFGGDLFFSGHTGLPFLLALIYWESPKLRLFFLAMSGIFATVVLLGHIHYSIDVLGAYFITFTIFHLSQKFFKKDELLLKNGIGVLATPVRK